VSQQVAHLDASVSVRSPGQTGFGRDGVAFGRGIGVDDLFGVEGGVVVCITTGFSEIPRRTASEDTAATTAVRSSDSPASIMPDQEAGVLGR
jgi:hypothetical protein